MFRLLSLFVLLSASATALVVAGQSAFGNEAVTGNDGPLYAIFKASPADTAYAAPLVGIAAVAAGYMLLRFLGFLISVCGAIVIAGMIIMVFFKPDWIESVRTLVQGVG